MICGTVSGLSLSESVQKSDSFYYTTQHYDVHRTGWFRYETKLTSANVHGLTKNVTLNVDGTVYAQPLYAHHVNIPGQGVHNVI
jgi:hypothetical protein